MKIFQFVTFSSSLMISHAKEESLHLSSVEAGIHEFEVKNMKGVRSGAAVKGNMLSSEVEQSERWFIGQFGDSCGETCAKQGLKCKVKPTTTYEKLRERLIEAGETNPPVATGDWKTRSPLNPAQDKKDQHWAIDGQTWFLGKVDPNCSTSYATRRGLCHCHPYRNGFNYIDSRYLESCGEACERHGLDCYTRTQNCEKIWYHAMVLCTCTPKTGRWFIGQFGDSCADTCRYQGMICDVKPTTTYGKLRERLIEAGETNPTISTSLWRSRFGLNPAQDTNGPNWFLGAYDPHCSSKSDNRRGLCYCKS